MNRIIVARGSTLERPACITEEKWDALTPMQKERVRRLVDAGDTPLTRAAQQGQATGGNVVSLDDVRQRKTQPTPEDDLIIDSERWGPISAEWLTDYSPRGKRHDDYYDVEVRIGEGRTGCPIPPGIYRVLADEETLMDLHRWQLRRLENNEWVELLVDRGYG